MHEWGGGVERVVILYGALPRHAQCSPTAPGLALCPPSHCRLVGSGMFRILLRVCSAMEGRGRDPGQRLAL
jgi:hypothetical protein